MKNVLIVSYFYPPCNIVASERPKSFAENFKQHGLNTTVVTRHWDGNESGKAADFEQINTTPPKITELESYTLIQLPYFAKGRGLYRAFQRNRLLSRFISLIYTMFGNFSSQMNAEKAFYDYLRDYLKHNKVDYLMVISSPLNIVKLGHLLAEEFDFSLIVDFRDLWDNGLLATDYKPGLETKVKNFFYEFHLKRWLKNAALITSVSEPLLEQIRRISPNAETTVVMNGFENDLLEKRSKSSNRANPKFTFSVIGTLYPWQDLSVLIEGLNLFLKDKSLNEIQLNFIGTGVFQEVETLLETSLPQECTLITNRIPHAQAVQKAVESHVLFYAGWKGYRGIVSGKIFEYLGAGKNILIAPSDNDIIARIVSETDAGKVADSPQEFAQILNQWFNEWKTRGDLAYKGKLEKIKFYSRENQAGLFAKEMKKITKTETISA